MPIPMWIYVVWGIAFVIGVTWVLHDIGVLHW